MGIRDPVRVTPHSKRGTGEVMKIRYWQSVRYKNDWELNFIGKRWNLRIARHQIAFWTGEAGEKVRINWINHAPAPF